MLFRYNYSVQPNAVHWARKPNNEMIINAYKTKELIIFYVKKVNTILKSLF